jgi:O-antigen ligase
MAAISRWRARVPSTGELLLAAVAALATLLLAFAGARKLGPLGVAAPLAVMMVIALLRKPVAMVALTVGLVVVCEGPSFGVLHFTSDLYGDIYRKLTAVDALVALSVVSVSVDLMIHRRPLRCPRALAYADMLLVLAMIAGVVTAHATGLGIRTLVLGENVLAYLVALPLAVVNLDIDRRGATRLLAGLGALAVVKAVLGLIEIAGHQGTPIEGKSTLTYYEPTANWLIMIALLCILAALLARVRPPRWLSLSAPLLFASLLLSYRRSFWVAAVLGLVLVALLGTSSAGRRMLVPVSLLIVLAIWVLGSINFQGSQSPIVRRVASLSPSKLETNLEDRYRLDERTNVFETIREHPITGLGMLVPWGPKFAPLSVEHPEARLYVHFAALWYWLKLGILGLCAYMALLVAAALCAWQVWRHSPEPLLRAFGLASLCGFAGLVAIETTATFTGADPRFTVLLAAQIGLLALLAQTAGDAPAQTTDAVVVAHAPRPISRVV